LSVKLLVLEAKLEVTKEQYEKLNEAIRTARFVRNICLRYWMENKNIGKYELSAYCAVLVSKFELANNLNSLAGQARAERAWSAISRFYDHCNKHKPGQEGYPRFTKQQTHGSVEYETSGGKLPEEGRYITLSDDFKAGTFKRWGSCDWHFYQLKQIKPVRVVRRADRYYA
jgi:putative transposase